MSTQTFFSSASNVGVLYKPIEMHQEKSKAELEVRFPFRPPFRPLLPHRLACTW